MENTSYIEQTTPVESRAQAVESMVKKLVEYTPPVPERKENETDIEYLSKLLEGNTKQRIRLSNVSEDWKQQNHDRAKVVCQEAIEAAMTQNKPLEIVVGPVGTIKWPKLHEAPENNEPDITELCAILHVIRIAQSVKKTYEPGCNITIGFEDVLGLHVIPDEVDNIKKSQENYFSKLKEVVQIACDLTAFPKEKINLLKESDTSNLSPAELEQQFAAEKDRLSPLIYSYLKRSDNLQNITPETVNSLPSYQAIYQEGWREVISRAARIDRKKKITKYQPEIHDDNVLTRKMAEFYAASLARKRLALDKHGPAVVYSLVPPSPGDPVPGKFFLRSIPTLDDNAPPWISQAVIEEGSSSKTHFLNSGEYYLSVVSPGTVQKSISASLDRRIETQEIKIAEHTFSLPVVKPKPSSF